MDVSHSARVLEFARVLDEIARLCETTLGSDALREWLPSFDPEIVRARVEKTGEARRLLRVSPPPAFGSARDVRAPTLAAAKGAALSGTDLFRIGETLAAFRRLRAWLDQARDDAPLLHRFADRLPWLKELEDRLAASIAEDGAVLDAASATLARVRSQKSSLQKRITDRLQGLVHGAFRDYLQEPLYTIRDGRFVLPVKAQYKGKVRGIVHDTSGSGQTVFVEPEAILGDSNRLRELESDEREEVERVLRELSGAVGEHADEISAGLEAVAELDAHLALARWAEERQAGVPRVGQGPYLRVEKGHHPLLDPNESVPVTVSVGGSEGSLLITGPNTGGKTVTLKLLGLYALLLGIGAHPPAGAVDYGVFRGVYADIGDEQSVEQSLSTFSGHLKNIARMLEEAGSGALALLDEVGAGTDPAEGSALGKALLGELLDRGVVVAATTHYGELKEFAQKDERIRPAAMEFDVETLRPTYRLIPGASGQSHALEIAERLGIPKAVLDRAASSMGEEFARAKSAQDELDRLVKEARRERAEVERLRQELQERQAELEAEVQRQRERYERLRARLEERVEEAVRQAQEAYDALRERTKETLSGREREEVLAAAREVSKRLESELQEVQQETGTASQPLNEGDSVRIKGAGRVGVIQALEGDRAVVLIGGLKVTVPLDRLERTDLPPTTPKPTTHTAHLSRPKTEQVRPELNIRKMRAEEAVEALEAYLDDVVLAGLDMVRIVHGRGDGILRRIVRETLEKRNDVVRFSDAPPSAGGDGVTVVHFR
ncbi:MAG: endonuclease MutS2 [Fimbriimonadales bacterium]|nr:MAG: endonuclease MutS2 [Fimbriimonadales bacterium]